MNIRASVDRDVHIQGKLLLCNTLKDFKALDLKRILHEESERLWINVTDQNNLNIPQFTEFYLAAFAVSRNTFNTYFVYLGSQKLLVLLCRLHSRFSLSVQSANELNGRICRS